MIRLCTLALLCLPGCLRHPDDIPLRPPADGGGLDAGDQGGAGGMAGDGGLADQGVDQGDPGPLTCTFERVNAPVILDPAPEEPFSIMSEQPPVLLWSPADGTFHAFLSAVRDGRAQPHWVRLSGTEGSLFGRPSPLCARPCANPAAEPGLACQLYSVARRPDGGAVISLFRNDPTPSMELRPISDPPEPLDCTTDAPTSLPYANWLDHPAHEYFADPVFEPDGTPIIAWYEYDDALDADGHWARGDSGPQPLPGDTFDPHVSGRAALARIGGRTVLMGIDNRSGFEQLEFMSTTRDPVRMRPMVRPEALPLNGARPSEAEIVAVDDRLWITVTAYSDAQWALHLLRSAPIRADGAGFEDEPWESIKVKERHIGDAQTVSLPGAVALTWYDTDQRELWVQLFDPSGAALAQAMYRMDADCEPWRLSMASNGAAPDAARLAIGWNCNGSLYVNSVRCQRGE